MLQNKSFGDDIIKIRKVLSDKIKDLELGKTLNHTVIENF